MYDIDDRGEYLEDIGLKLGWNKNLRKCQVCHDRWHSAEYETCYDCRPNWLFFDRREFTQDQRMEIFERDDYKCAKCGTRDEFLQIDHIMPCMRGGEADLWNGQVLCMSCNLEKAGDWHNSQWPRRRNELIHFYLTFGWGWLSYEERELLVSEASNKRMITGYFPFSGIVDPQWLEDRATEGRIVIIDSRPKVSLINGRVLLPAHQVGPVPAYINVVSAQLQQQRPLGHGGRFGWHTHVRGLTEPPQWAIEEANSYA